MEFFHDFLDHEVIFSSHTVYFNPSTKYFVPIHLVTLASDVHVFE